MNLPYQFCSAGVLQPQVLPRAATVVFLPTQAAHAHVSTLLQGLFTLPGHMTELFRQAVDEVARGRSLHPVLKFEQFPCLQLYHYEQQCPTPQGLELYRVFKWLCLALRDLFVLHLGCWRHSDDSFDVGFESLRHGVTLLMHLPDY